jgi:hypothetical protein
MTTQSMERRGGGGYLERPSPSSLADVVEVILDKGLVIDAYVRVSLVGIELITIDARIVIASVDTYLRFAEATNRLDLYEKGGQPLTEALGDLQESGAAKKVGGAVRGAKKALTSSSSDDDDDESRSSSRRPSSSRRRQREDA